MEEEYDAYTFKTITFDDKIWVYKSFYPTDLEKKLRDGEEVHIINNILGKYVAKTEEKTIEIEVPYFGAKITMEQAVEILREIAETLANKFSNAKEIKIVPGISNKKSILKIDGVEHEGRIIKQHRPCIISLAASEELEKEYTQFINKTTGQKRILYIIGKYAIEDYFNHIGIFDITKPEQIQQEPEPPINIKEKILKTETVGLEAYIDATKKPRIISTKSVPNNAFIIEVDPLKYIQFTDSGFIITNGVLFATNELHEVRLPWYIVEKQDKDWVIYIHANSEYDGVYKTNGTKLEKILWCGAIIIDTIPLDECVYAGCDGSIYYHNGEYVSPFRQKVKKSDVDERLEVKINGKIIYVPKILIKNILPPIT